MTLRPLRRLTAARQPCRGCHRRSRRPEEGGKVGEVEAAAEEGRREGGQRGHRRPSPVSLVDRTDPPTPLPLGCPLLQGGELSHPLRQALALRTWRRSISQAAAGSSSMQRQEHSSSAAARDHVTMSTGEWLSGMMDEWGGSEVSTRGRGDSGAFPSDTREKRPSRTELDPVSASGPCGRSIRSGPLPGRFVRAAPQRQEMLMMG